MGKIFEYIKLIVFVTAILVGIQVPGFVDQYGKHLSARVAESNQNLAAFQRDANKFFAGDLNKLVAHYRKQQDPVFIDGGKSIEQIVLRNQLLTDALLAFKQNFYSPYIHVFLQPIYEIRQQVWQQYNYTVVLNGSSILVGIAIAILLLSLFELTVFSCVCGCRKLVRKAPRKVI